MTKAIRTPQPDASGNVADPLTEILSTGAQRLIEQGIEAELTALLVAIPARLDIALGAKLPLGK